MWQDEFLEGLYLIEKPISTISPEGPYFHLLSASKLLSAFPKVIFMTVMFSPVFTKYPCTAFMDGPWLGTDGCPMTKWISWKSGASNLLNCIKECWALSINICSCSFHLTTAVRASLTRPWRGCKVHILWMTTDSQLNGLSEGSSLTLFVQETGAWPKSHELRF